MLFGTRTQKPYASNVLLNDETKSSLSGLRKDDQSLNCSEPLNNKVLCEEDAQTTLDGQRRFTW